MPDATTPPKLPPTVWKRYKKLLYRYNKARDEFAIKGAKMPEDLVWIDHEYRLAKDALNDFVATLIGNRHK